MSKFTPKPFGKYFLVDKLAVGGMAEIYKAKTFGVDGFEKQLVIKKILPHCAEDKDFIHMLVDEAKLSVLLSHTNIVQVYDLGKVGDDYFISMEFIDGCNLRQVINRGLESKQKLPIEIIVYIASEICKGLDYAHHKRDAHNRPLNIVHRDVSPQNILISYEGEVKIVDFGIAKAAMNIGHTMAGMLKGKVSYMSPEQALGKPLDGRTDIFSVGSLFYELLTGKKLFTGESQFEVLKKIHTTHLTEASFPDTIPTTLKPLLSKALAYRPQDRYANAGDFQIELTKHLYSTYRDFSPRQLSALLQAWFAEELHSRKEKALEELATLDSKTQTALMRASAENIVHRTETNDEASSISLQKTATHAPHTPAAPKDNAKTPPTPKLLEPTEHSAVGEKKKKHIATLTLVASILVLIVIGSIAYVIYTNFKNTQSDATDELPPSTPQTNKTPPPQETPSPPPVAKASLRIESLPPGALLTINGAPFPQVTPTTLSDLEIGKTYHLSLSKEGYVALTNDFTPANSQPLSWQAELKPVQGDLTIASIPSEASITLDGEDLNQTTPTHIEGLALGEAHELALKKNGYNDLKQSFSLTVDHPSVQLSLTLQAVAPAPQTPPQAPVVHKEKAKEHPQPSQPQAPPISPPSPPPPTPSPPPASGDAATLIVESSPSGATVTINGTRVGKTPGSFSVTPGQIELLVQEPGLTPYRQVLHLDPKEKRHLDTVDFANSPRGKVRINSVPKGATVKIDGQDAGHTPLVLKGVLKNKDYRVEVSYPGYKTSSKVLTLTEKSLEWVVSLEKE